MEESQVLHANKINGGCILFRMLEEKGTIINVFCNTSEKVKMSAVEKRPFHANYLISLFSTVKFVLCSNGHSEVL